VSCSLLCLAAGVALLVGQWWLLSTSLGGKPSRMVGTGDSDHCTSAQPTLCLGMISDPLPWAMLLIRQTCHRKGGRNGAKQSDLPMDLKRVSGRRRSSVQISCHPDLHCSSTGQLDLEPLSLLFLYYVWLLTVLQVFSLWQTTPFLHLCLHSCCSVPPWLFTDVKPSLELNFIWKNVIYQGIRG